MIKIKAQNELLNTIHKNSSNLVSFKEKLSQCGYKQIAPKSPEILQINMGRLCNQSCKHCHVNAGLDKTETMNRETMEQCLDILKQTDISIIDITGGAPEMNDHFRWFINKCREMNKKVMVRCNLTVFFHKDEFLDFPRFYADNDVEVIASLPFYSAYKTDKLRGTGVFKQSIEGLKLLNKVGYAQPHSDLVLNLVYNPAGAFLPGSQKDLENTFKKELYQNHNITFTNLFTITNIPIGRYLEYLINSENFIPYMEKLAEAFNPESVPEIMCRNTLSVSWDGHIYDCDFNQMLDLKIDVPGHTHISNFNMEAFLNRNIVFSQHCFGCTAGAGSSCGGATV